MILFPFIIVACSLEKSLIFLINMYLYILYCYHLLLIFQMVPDNEVMSRLTVDFLSGLGQKKPTWPETCSGYLKIGIFWKPLNCSKDEIAYTVIRSIWQFLYHLIQCTCIVWPLSRKTTLILRPPILEQIVLIMYRMDLEIKTTCR